ncbi:ATP-binding cassette domain-containing protein [Actinoplanes sp. NPDC049802]|uniref:ATP-binding cassette domain-containing protein n=1 Tax=Actinoplanes sp. NPDC049802 TaxID=3154742 RepID=UPI0033F11EC2
MLREREVAVVFVSHILEEVMSLCDEVPSAEAASGSLSGGNQQKVVVAKWLDNEPSTILLDDPTRGVDIGARAEIHALVRATARAGAVVLFSSNDLAELAAATDRVLVFYRGRICAELRGGDKTSKNILHLMNTGAEHGPAE